MCQANIEDIFFRLNTFLRNLRAKASDLPRKNYTGLVGKYHIIDEYNFFKYEKNTPKKLDYIHFLLYSHNNIDTWMYNDKKQIISFPYTHEQISEWLSKWRTVMELFINSQHCCCAMRGAVHEGHDSPIRYNPRDRSYCSTASRSFLKKNELWSGYRFKYCPFCKKRLPKYRFLGLQ